MTSTSDLLEGSFLEEKDKETVNAQLKEFLDEIKLPQGWYINFHVYHSNTEDVEIDFYNESSEDENIPKLEIWLRTKKKGRKINLIMDFCGAKLGSKMVQLNYLPINKIKDFLERYEEINNIFEEIGI
jgi:hypothetical protein